MSMTVRDASNIVRALTDLAQRTSPRRISETFIVEFDWRTNTFDLFESYERHYFMSFGPDDMWSDVKAEFRRAAGDWLFEVPDID